MTERWGMVIDVNRCVGCQTCTAACKHENDTTPGVQWRRVLDVESGTFPDVERLFLVVGCQHCAEPPCVPVCPTGATRQRADGLVTMDYDLCIGCAACAVACPYQARTIVHEPGWYFGRDTAQERHTAHPERTGVAQKCTFCVDKVEYIDYKDLRRIRNLMTERGKIISRRISGNCARHQRQLTTAIKRARNIALLPFAVDRQ